MTTEDAVNYILMSEDELAKQAAFLASYYYLFEHEDWPTHAQLRTYLPQCQHRNFWTEELKRRATP